MSRIIIVTVIVLFSVCSVSLAQSKKKRKKTQKINLIIKTAKSYTGTPYKYGGTNYKGIDCSSLIQNSYAKAGYSIPRTSKEQSKFGKKVGWGNAKKGDVVFFKFKEKREKWYHSGLITFVEPDHIYFIHASSSRGVVQSDLYSKYYKTRVKSIRRIVK